MIFILLGCSEARCHSAIDNKNNSSQSLSKENFPFYEIQTWRIDTAKYDGPYSELGEFYQKNIFLPKAYRNTIPIGFRFVISRH